jgi:hypothetical protein
MASIHYPKIASHNNFSKYTEIQEKLDGSQMSFIVSDTGNMTFFNRGRLIVEPYDEMFRRATSMLLIKHYLIPTIYIMAKLYVNTVITYNRTPHLYFV